MKKILCAVAIIVSVFVFTSCGNPYVDPDTNKVDTSALATDALDEAFPEIIENLSEEQLGEILLDDRCEKVLRAQLIEEMQYEAAAFEEYYTVEDVRSLMEYAFGEEGLAWADDLMAITGGEILEKFE